MFVPGTIETKIIKGARGDFVVGMLTTPIGTFEVKAQGLDQYEEGTYEGRFDITDIFIDHYSTRTRQIISKLCARVTEIIITTIEPEVPETPTAPAEESSAGEIAGVSPLVETGFLRDPLDEVATPESSTASTAQTDEPAPAEKTATASPASTEPGSDLVSLFGDEASDVAMGASITLDPASSIFRTQIACLKKLGFKYQPSEKQWAKQA